MLELMAFYYAVKFLYINLKTAYINYIDGLNTF